MRIASREPSSGLSLGASASSPPWTRRVAIRFALFQAAFITGVTSQKAASNALFLSRADPEDLPYLYVGVAIFVAVLTTSLAKLLSSHNASRLLPIFVISHSVLLVLFGLGAAFDVPYATGALYVEAEAGTTATSILLWGRVSDAFGAREQRKVVGMISAAGMVGSILGGTGVSFAAETVGVPAVVVVSAMFAPLALLFLKRIRGKVRGPVTVKPAPLGIGVRYLATRGLPRSLAMLVLLLSATASVVDYVFRVTVAATFDEVELTGVFGILNAGVGVVAALIQLTLTSRILSRVGVFWFAAIVPTTSLLLATAYVAAPLVFPLGILFALKFSEMLGAYSLNSTAITLLYNPMPEEVRTQLRALIDGTIKKAGGALAGVTLAVLVAFVPPRGLLCVAIALCLGILFLLPRLRKHYLIALDDKLGRRRRKSAPVPALVTDRETIGVLVRALESDDTIRVLIALRTLAREAALPRDMIARLLCHPSDEVRREALRHVPQADDSALTEQLVAFAHQENETAIARAAAVRGLSRAAPRQAASIAAKFLRSEKIEVKMAAVELILQRDREDVRAREILDDHVTLLATSPPNTRQEVARVLGALEEDRYDSTLVVLILDDDALVRGRAIKAAGREKHATLVPALIESLADAQVRALAIGALVGFGDAVIPAISAQLNGAPGGGQHRDYRRHLPRVLARIGTDAAAHALLTARPREEASLQRTCVERLLEICRRHPETKIDDVMRHDAIEHRLKLARVFREMNNAFTTTARRSDGKGSGGKESKEKVAPPPLEVRVLARLLVEREDQALRLAHLLIGVAGDLDRSMAAYRSLSPLGVHGAPSTRRRQDALDLLDHVLAKDRLRQPFLAIVEDAPALPLPGDREIQIDKLQASSDPLVRGLARRAAIALRRPQVEVSSAKATLAGAENLDVDGEDMEESILDRAIALDHADLFEGLSLDDLAVIATVATQRELEPEETLYRQGDVGESLYIIQSGRIHLLKGDSVILTLEEGESAGQVSFLDRGTRPVTARVSAKGPARVLAIQRGDLMDLFADRPALMQAFFAVVGARLRTLLQRDV